MKIACLQFSPRVGEVAANFSRAEALLMRKEREGELDGLDLLVLPEMAFSGYNHPSLSAIAPYLEPTAAGPSTRWASRTAKRLQCTVAVGYPENATAESSGNFNTVFDSQITTETTTETIAYNSLVFVNCHGEVIAHYRKAFLYYTDEVWAKEGPERFYTGILALGRAGEMVKMAAGICMDINPYKFESPWTAYEFANHCREAKVKVVVVSMAWLTHLSREELFGSNEEEDHNIQMQPDLNTVGYWIERFRPLLGINAADEEVIVVFGNRAGEEGWADRIGDVRYAGSSSVMGMSKGSAEGQTNVRIWGILGRAEDGLLVVNTASPPLYTVQRKASAVVTTDTEVAEALDAVETDIEARE